MGKKMLRHMAALLLVLTAAWGAAACSSGIDTPDSPDYGSLGDVWLKITLHMNTQGSTRAADPMGGEDGDGRESALARENRIRDLNIFIYTLEGGNGLNSENPADIAVKKQIFVSTEATEGFDREDFTDNGTVTASLVEKTVKIEGYIPTDHDWVLVVANAGHMAEAGNLAELRERSFSCAAWTGNAPKDATFFTMATARFATTYDGVADGKIQTDGRDGSREDPFNVQTTIERTAARIDFWYEGKNIDSAHTEELTYDVTADTETLAQVMITHIVPVNIMQRNSYMFKHVTDGFDTGSILVCSDETPKNGRPKNYVIEPTTLSKNSWQADQRPAPEALYGNTRAGYIRDNPNLTEVFSKATSVAAILKAGESGKYSEKGLPYNRYTILGYANENTETGTGLTSDYTTGLAIRAVYKPATVYSAYDPATGSLTEDGAYDTGGDIWQYSPTAHELGEKFNLYFSSKQAADAYMAAHPEKNGKITCFKGGVCYYNLWLRHANVTDDPHTPFEMEYAIVRNNIYRVGVSFTGPGTPTPEVREPDNIVSRIFVRKWNFRLQEVIEI